jgi:hypothetical protein
MTGAMMGGDGAVLLVEVEKAEVAGLLAEPLSNLDMVHATVSFVCFEFGTAFTVDELGGDRFTA